MRLRKLFKHKSVRVTSVLLFMFLLLGFQYACLDGLNGDSSGNPINTAIIGLSANPPNLFGNSGDDSVIQVNTNLVPDGTPIEFEITFSPTGLRPELRGCLFNSTGTVEGNPVFMYHDAFNPNRGEVDDLKARYREGKVGDVEVKTKLAQAVNALLDPIRERRANALARPGYIRDVLIEGSRKARAIAEQTMERVRAAVKLKY